MFCHGGADNSSRQGYTWIQEGKHSFQGTTDRVQGKEGSFLHKVKRHGVKKGDLKPSLKNQVGVSRLLQAEETLH